MKTSVKLSNIQIIYGKSLELGIHCHHEIMGEITIKEYEKYRDDLLDTLNKLILNQKEYKFYHRVKVEESDNNVD